MTIHSFHPDSHTHGLADDCPRCSEHAESPLLGLDHENLGVLARRIALSVPARSENEALAMRNLKEAIMTAGHASGAKRD